MKTSEKDSRHRHQFMRKKQWYVSKKTKISGKKGANDRVEIENLKAHYPLLMNFQFQENHKPLSTLPQNNKKKKNGNFAQLKRR